MNATLPAGIEAYLKEAGFSATEMIILRKLVEEDALTLRELAAKTGKSTGVLDQAMKKLLTKKIAEKRLINDQPKYSIHSLDAIVKWVQRDMRERKEMLDRKHQNFEQFIASLKMDKQRPDMEYFQGLPGIQQAYLALLETGKELLTVMPILTTAEEDPLRDFKVEYFRKRQYRKIFQRVLTPDAPLSRRFQSRDSFEYRKTLLLPPEECTPGFEQTIVGDTLACIDMKNETACFIKFPGLAQAERANFEMQWERQMARGRGEPRKEAMVPVVVPLKTRLLSSFREFILSKKSITIFAIFAILSAALSLGLYFNNREFNLQRLREKITAIAATSALQFNADDINAVKEIGDIKKPEYAKMIATLNLVRRSNKDIEYAYIMRPTNDEKKFTFVADADSLDPTLKKDINSDGIINQVDELNYPGESYDISAFPAMREALIRPVSDVGIDQWGSLISGFAPIRDSKGLTVAIVGIDIFASRLDYLSTQFFGPLYIFLGFLFLFTILRFWAINRSLVSECFEAMRKRALLSFLCLIFIFLAGFCAYKIIHFNEYHSLLNKTGERLQAIAITGARDFDIESLNKIRFAKDMNTDDYQRIFVKLNEIRNFNPYVTYAYILRPVNDDGMFEFIADADANYNLATYSSIDIYDVILSAEDENVYPGYKYYDNSGIFTKALRRPVFGIGGPDKWGSFVVGACPIFDKSGNAVAVLAVDLDLKLFDRSQLPILQE